MRAVGHMNGIGKIIAKKRKEAGMSQGELAEKMQRFGFNPSAASVSSWEKDVSVPNALQFLAICQELQIDDVADLFFENGKKSDALHGLNEEGKRRAKEYISLLLLSDEFREKKSENEMTGLEKNVEIRTPKQVVARRCVSEVKRDKKMPEATKVYRLYNLPASAGPGEFLDGEDYIEVEATPDIPAATDFGIRIKGDSMEPRFHDGDTVWVKKCDSIYSGEIGIFFLDGKAYCKKLQKDKYGVSLVSINTEYKPIIITEDSNLVTFGKVLS